MNFIQDVSGSSQDSSSGIKFTRDISGEITPTDQKKEFSPFDIAMMGGDPSIMGADTFRNAVRPIDIAASTAHQFAMPILGIPAQVIATIMGGLNPGTTGKIEREAVNQTMDAMTLKPGDVESVIRSIAGMPPVQDYTPEQGIGAIDTAWNRTPRGEGPAAAQGSEAINKVLEAAMPSTYITKGFEKVKEAGKLSSGDEGLEGIIPGSMPSETPRTDLPKWALSTIDQAEFWTGLTADLGAFALAHKTGTKLNRSFKNYVARRAKGTNTIDDISGMLDKLEKAKAEVPPEKLDAKIEETFFQAEAALKADRGRVLNNAEQKTAVAKQRELQDQLNKGVPKEKPKPEYIPSVEGETIAPVEVKPEPVVKPSGGPKTGPGIARRMSKELGIKIKYDGSVDNTDVSGRIQHGFTADLGDGKHPSFTVVNDLSLDAATSALDPVLKGFLGKEEVKPVEPIKSKLEVVEGRKGEIDFNAEFEKVDKMTPEETAKAETDLANRMNKLMSGEIIPNSDVKIETPDPVIKNSSKPSTKSLVEDLPTFKTLDDATLGGFEVRTNRSFKTKEAAQKFVNKIFEREQKGEKTKGIEPGSMIEPVLVNGKYRIGEAIDLIGEELEFAKQFPDQPTAKSRVAFEKLVQEEAGKAVEKFQFSGVEEMTSRLEELQAPVVEWLKNPEGKIVDPLENEIRAIGWELPKDHYMQQGIDRILEAINKKKAELGIEEKVEFDATGEKVTGEDILLEFDKLTPEELKALDPNTEVGAAIRDLFGEETGTSSEFAGMFDHMKWTKEPVKDFKSIFDFVKDLGDERGSISFKKEIGTTKDVLDRSTLEKLRGLGWTWKQAGLEQQPGYSHPNPMWRIIEPSPGLKRPVIMIPPKGGLGERGSFSIRDLPEEKIKQMKKIVDEAGADLIGFLKTKGFDEKAAKTFADAAEQLKEVKSTTPFADKLKEMYPENDYEVGENTRKGKPRKYVANDKEYIVTQTSVWEGERTAIMEANELPHGLVRGAIKNLENPIRTMEKISPALKPILLDKYHIAEKAIIQEWKAEVGKIKDLRKGTTRKMRNDIGKFWFNQQRDGARMLEAMGVKDIPKELTGKELEIYNALRGKFDELWDRVNDSRVQFGKRPMNYTSNYLTFAREIGLAERLGLKTNLVLDEKGVISKRAQAKSTSFRPAMSRFTDKVFPLKLDPFEIYANYAQNAIRHVNMSPVISKAAALREPLFDPKTGKRFLLKNEKPNTSEFIREWSNAIAGIDESRIPTLVKRGMMALNRNITFSVLSANLRSALIQPSALRNTYTAIGEKHLISGIVDTLNPAKRKFAFENSNVLETAAYDQSVNDAFKSLSTFNVVGKAQRGVAKAGLWPLKFLDYESRMATWNGGYSFGKANGLSKGQAIRFADDLVTRTQGSGLAGDVAPIQRNALGKFVTLFQTFNINDFGFLTQDVLGISKGRMNKKNFAMAARYIIATTAMNSMFEDVLGIKSPFPTPYTALRDGLEDGDSIPKVMGKVAMEFAETLPVLGGVRYGSTPLGPGVQLVGELAQKFTDSPMQKPGLELAGKVAGVTGTAQIGKALRAKKRGESLWGQLMGTYTKNSSGGGGRRRRGTSSGFSRGF